MKKRIFALATALVMTLSMGMTALAAKSPNVEDDSYGDAVGMFAESATAVIDGKVVELDFTWRFTNMIAEATEEQKEQLYYYIRETDDEVSAAKAAALFEQVMGYKKEGVDYNDWFGLDLPDEYTMPAGGVEVTINAPYAGKGDYNYYIFHCKEDGTWEYIPTTEGNGTLSGRFTSFSPVFIMRVPKAGASTTSSNVATTKEVTAEKTSTTSSVKAPKTGEYAEICVAGMMAILSAAGIVVYVGRKKVVK